MSAPPAKESIRAITAYVGGQGTGADGRPLIKLSSNENPLGCSLAAGTAYAQAASSLHRYPDAGADALRAALGQAYGLEPERLVCGTGSDEILHMLATAYAGPGDEVIHVQYGFMVYDIATRCAGAKPVVAPARAYGTDVDAVLARVTDQTRLVYIANPNNPTGTFLPRTEIERLHAGLRPDIVLVIDQAYAEYLPEGTDDGALDLARTRDNVVVTRTFSKIYGLAAERIGWGYGAPDIIDILHRVRGPFNVTTGGQAAAIAALHDQDHVARSRAHNAQWRQWLAEHIAALGAHGLSIVPSEGNFLLILFEGAFTAERANQALLKAGLAVRWLPGMGLGHALRITIGTETEMKAVIACLHQQIETLA